MNIHRLRELIAAGKAGSIRPEELKELFEALPDVLDLALTGENFIEALKKLQECADAVPLPNVPPFDDDAYAGRFGY
jgi:ATP:corrinoid adenosyltransferase